MRNDKITQLLEKRQEQDEFELNRALNEFRMLHQQPDSRREFDLYDPDYLKKDKPARVSDDDPRCGISSLQRFDGMVYYLSRVVRKPSFLHMRKQRRRSASR